MALTQFKFSAWLSLESWFQARSAYWWIWEQREFQPWCAQLGTPCHSLLLQEVESFWNPQAWYWGRDIVPIFASEWDVCVTTMASHTSDSLEHGLDGLRGFCSIWVISDEECLCGELWASGRFSWPWSSLYWSQERRCPPWFHFETLRHGERMRVGVFWRQGDLTALTFKFWLFESN